MVQLIGRTYRASATLSVWVGFYQCEGGSNWWRTVTTLHDRGEVFKAEARHATRSGAMRQVRACIQNERDRTIPRTLTANGMPIYTWQECERWLAGGRA